MRRLLYSATPGRDYSAEPMLQDANSPLHEPSPSMSLLQVLAILRCHWRLSLAIFGAVVVLSALTIKLLPKTYTATATLIVDPAKKDPLAVASDVSDFRLSNYVATQLELIQSPVILMRVVDRMNLTADPDFAAGFKGGSIEGLREYTEKNLASSVKVDLGRGGELLYVSAAATTSVRAADIANTIADTYIEEERNRLSGPASERAQRYSQDLSALRDKVAAAQDKLTAFLQRQGITDVVTTGPEATDIESQALKSLETQLLQAQDQRRALEAKSTGEATVSDEAMASPAIQELKTQLSALQTKLAQLSVTYGAQHPRVIEVRNQIATTRQQLTNALRTMSENTATQLQRARQLEAKYAQAVAEQHTKVLNLREHQGQGAKLKLELDSAQSVYKRALDGYDQFMFASAQTNSDLSLVSRATIPVKATSPNTIKLMIIGVVCGLGLGIGLPLLYELLFDRRVRCRDDIERSFGLPVLANFEAIALPPL